MKDISKIIVPIDFLQHTDQLAEFAVYIAGKFNANLLFIYVIELPHYFEAYEYPSLGVFTIEATEHAEEMMDQFIKKYREVCSNCEGKVLQGNIVDSIIKYTNDEKAELIIIGTHGRKGLEKMWLGSIAERVIKNAPCPTLTCNPNNETL